MAASSQIFMGQSCIPQSFAPPSVFGAQITNIEANLVTNFSMDIPQGVYWSHHPVNVKELAFCNVSVAYTHPGYNDDINTMVWLPVENWNGRLQGSGGGGFLTGLVPEAMTGAVNDGYAVVSTDGGHTVEPFDASSWALTSPGNINWALLQDFASIALGDAAEIGKSIVKDFYGRSPVKSYWNGCSTGGRQGLMLAQRYPTAYDGLLVAAPAIHFPKFIVAEFWPQMVMHDANEYPPPCELDAITQAAVEACDELDGVKDGIISYPDLCKFDAKTLIGKEVDCEAYTGKKAKISELAAKIATVFWEGARKEDGSFVWHGFNHDATMTGAIGLATNTCDESGCEAATFPIVDTWIKWFLKRDPDFDVKTLKHSEAIELFHLADQQFRSILGTDDPDLSAFKRAGGKMISWHGSSDQVIMPNGIRDYYDEVTRLDANVHDYFRFFQAPGVWHCSGGPGPFPGSALEKLVEWVEEGEAPNTIPARGQPGEEGQAFERNLCHYPHVQRYKGSGDIRSADSFECV